MFFTAQAVARMCAASEIAHRKTSPSPRRLKSSLPPESSQRPTMATPAAAHAIDRESLPQEDRAQAPE